MIEEEDDILKINKKQKKQLQAFSQKIEELISEYKNRKKFGIPKLKEDTLQKVDLQQYNEFFQNMEELKKMANACKTKLNNDDKFDEITKKEDELKYLKKQLKEKNEEYQYLLETEKKMKGFENKLLDEEIDYYKKELKTLKEENYLLNKKYLKTNKDIGETQKHISKLEDEYYLIQKNIEFKRSFKNYIQSDYNGNTEESFEREKKSGDNMIENARNVYDEKIKEKEILEKEVNKLNEKLLQYQYEAHLNDLKLIEIQKIETQLRLNQNKEKKKINNLKKSDDIDKKIRTKRMKNLMAESFKKNFPFKNNYKILLEEEKKQKKDLNVKPKLNIAKNKMKNSHSSMDIFNSKRDEIKKKREKEKQEFMINLDKELKAYDEQKGETIKEIKLLKDDIEKSLESNKIYENYLDKIKKEN